MCKILKDPESVIDEDPKGLSMSSLKICTDHEKILIKEIINNINDLGLRYHQISRASK